MPQKQIRELYFGRSSAESEVSDDPGRFLETFYDRWDVVRKVDDRAFFLIVGPKGSGKTAISEYIRLRTESDKGRPQALSSSLNLDDITPGFTSITAITSKLVSDQSTGVTDSAWRLFISVRLLELMLKDNSSSLSTDPQISALRDRLSDAGLLAKDFPSVLRKVRENSFTLNLAGILTFGRSASETDQIPVSRLGEALQEIVLSAESSSTFTLSIDGLDRIIGDNEAYWATLAALLRVSEAYHQKLRKARARIRLFVMCRSDVFRRITFSDADKIAGDSTLFTDWGAQQTKATDSPLWDYLAAKARITPEQLLAFIPGTIEVGENGPNPRRIDGPEYMLTSTRSTPREMTMLMKRLQEEVPPNGSITSARVRTAVDNFATRDLLTTVAAESTGALGTALGNRLDQILSGLPCASGLLPKDLEDSLKTAEVEAISAQDLASFLFLAGLIGNRNQASGYVQFYHRRDTYKLNRNGPWQLHRALMYAFNIPFNRGAINRG